MPGAPYARIRAKVDQCYFSIHLSVTHGQETTGTPQLFLVTTQEFRLHHVRERELHALI